MPYDFLRYTFYCLQFSSYSVSVLLQECHECPAAAISVCLRCGQRGYFRSECCTGGEIIHKPKIIYSSADNEVFLLVH